MTKFQLIADAELVDAKMVGNETGDETKMLTFSETHFEVTVVDVAECVAEVVYSPVSAYRNGDLVILSAEDIPEDVQEGKNYYVHKDSVIGTVDGMTLFDEVEEWMDENAERVRDNAKKTYDLFVAGMSKKVLRETLLETAASGLIIVEMIDNGDFEEIESGDALPKGCCSKAS